MGKKQRSRGRAARGVTGAPDTGRPALIVPRPDAETRLADRIGKGEELRSRLSAAQGLGGIFNGSIAIVRDDYSRWDEYNAELLRLLFSDASISIEYARRPTVMMAPDDLRGQFDQLDQAISRKLSKLVSIKERIELYAERPTQASPAAPDRTSAPAPAALPREVFIVHGHDEAARETTARLLEQLDIRPVILHEQVNRGRTIIEKFVAHANVPFAVVLMTPDDIGGAVASTEPQRPRARQNVILELGYFVGKLGRDKVCALHKAGLDLPSDIHGVVYVPLDEAGAWKVKLAEEIDAAGIPVDLNRLRTRRRRT